MNQRINIDPEICSGKPVIKGTRVLVCNILADLADGMTFEEIIQNYPNIQKEDIVATLQFSSELSQFDTFSLAS